jgi:hypothetical protein
MTQTGPTGETLDYIGLAQKFGFSPNTFFGHTGFIGLEYISGATGFYFEIPGVTGTQFYLIGPTGPTGSNDPFAGLTGFNATDFLDISKDLNFKASIYFGSATGPTGSNYFQTSKILNLTNIRVEYYFKHTLIIEDVSASPAALALLAEIDTLISKIDSNRLKNLGRLEDYYQDIFSIINVIDDIKLQFNLQSIQDVAESAEQITELLGSFNTKLETILELITGEELTIIKESLDSFLRMLEAYENFVMVIESQMIVRGECMAFKLTGILDNVYNNIRKVFHHSPCVNALPAYMLCDDFSDIQYRIDKFEGYSEKLNEFAQSLGLECLPPIDEKPSFIDLLLHEKKYSSSSNPCKEDV